MSVFLGIEHVSAEGTSSRQYFEEGNYVVEIDSVFLHEKRLGGGKLFIVETTVKESDNPRIRPGEQRNWVQSLALPYALPRIKSFIAAAIGLYPQRQPKEINTRVTAAACDGVVSDDNPLHGKSLRLTCSGKTTQAGREFLQHTWGPHDETR